MKIIKYAFGICLLVLTIIGCSQDDNSTDFVNGITAPTNVSALVTVTQDNTGLVTITPLGEGVSNFEINFGDNSDSSGIIQPGSNVQHVYEEGTYQASIVANGLNGLTTTVVQDIVVSFQAPQNLVVTIENDPAVSKQVNIMASAEFALSYEVDFGDTAGTTMMANIEEPISFIYDEAGVYTISVTAFSAAIETTNYSEDFEVTEILQPITPAPVPTIPSANVISIYSDVYTPITVSELPTAWSGSGFDEIQVEGDNIIQYFDLDFTGIVTDYANPTNLTNMDYVHFDYWTSNGVELGFKIVNTVNGQEDIESVGTVIQGEWVSVEIDLNDFDMDRSQVTQLLFDNLVPDDSSITVFIDNLFFYKEETTTLEGLEGTWRMASTSGSLGVGPTVGDISWFTCDDACVAARACYFDDTYTFGSDGSFANDLGAESWIEGWQGGGDSCGVPVAPHDGSNPATYTYNEAAGTVTLNGVGAFLGLAKANNSGELSNPADAPASITYNVAFTGVNTIDVYIEAGAGVFWQYKLVRDAAVSNPLEGTWVMASESGSLGVGPTVGDISWFTCDDACVAARACYFDDTYTFGSDGSFANDLGAESWIEGWQGGGDSCGAPVAPHDGSNPATFTYNEAAGTVTLNGVGAFLGLAKANNTGELSNPADAPASITYNISFIDSNTISVYIEAGAGVFWQYKLVKI